MSLTLKDSVRILIIHRRSSRSPENAEFGALSIQPKTSGTFLGKFPDIRKLLTFRNANHSTENSGDSWRKIPGKKLPKIRVYLAKFLLQRFRIMLFHLRLEISGNLNLTFSGVGMESALGHFTVLFYRRWLRNQPRF